MSRVIKEIFKSKTEEFCYKVGGKTLFGALVQVASEDGFSLESETYYDADGEEIDPTTVEEIDCDCAVRPTQVIIESSCDDPTYIAGCPDNPIPVEITNPPSDYEYVNSGWICGEGDTWVTTTTVYIDGVAGEPVVTDSGISCEEPAPLDQIDTEKLEICDPITKTIHIKVCQYTTSYDDDGVPTTVENEISYTDTNVKCDVDVVDVDTEFVCNTDTNVWDMTQVTTTNGVPADPVVTPTTTPCDEDKPDFEQPRVCRDGTVHILTNQIDIDGTVTELSAVDTGEECNQQPKTIQCLKDQFIEGGLDNSFTNFTHTNQIFTTLFSDGSVDTFNIASATGWTDQVSQMAVGLGSIMPWAHTVDPFCTNGCGGLPAPFVELNEMVARYVGFRVCPSDVVPVSVSYVSDQRKEPVELVIQYVVTDPIYIDRCVSCDGEESFKVKGEDYSPICPVPCTDVAPEVPIPTCQIIDTLSVCVATLEEDEELNVEPVLVESDVFLSFTDCGDGAITSNAYTIDADGTAVPYELAPENYFANCETLEPVSPPPPECPEGAQFSPVQLPAARYGIQDNSRYTLLDGSILNHLQNGNDYEYTYSYQGTTVAVHQQTSDPYYNDLINTGEASIGCSIKAICANHTSPKGCNANQVANLADYPAYDSPTFPADVQNNLTNPDQDELWASGWMLECAGCNKEIDRVTITKSNNPDHVGAYKDLTFYEKEPEIVYQAITCAGTFYKGCDGNDIADPTSGCCVTAPTAPADMSWWEQFKTKCDSNNIPDANYEGGIEWSIGRPNTGAEWILWDNTSQPAVEYVSGSDFGEFIENMEALGYTEWSSGESHYFCPCPPNLVNAGDYFVTVDGNTVTKPACTPLGELPSAPEKQEIEEFCALRTKGCLDQAILDSSNQTNALLEELLDCMCNCPDCPEIIQGAFSDTDTGANLTFPISVDGTFLNWTTQLMFPSDIDCLDNNPDALVSVKITQDHEAGTYPLHRAYILSASAGTFTSQSASNSINNVPLGGGAIGIGYDANDPISNARNIRWVKLTATVADWQAGISLSALGFGAVNSGVETIHSFEAEICPDLQEICNDC